MKTSVFHNTYKEKLADILNNGINTSYRNKKSGYSKTDFVVNLDIELDKIADKYFKNKPKRHNSNFAWLDFEKAKLLKFCDQIILEIIVDINTIYVSNQGLWQLCYKHVDNVDKTDFRLFAQVYWKNVIPYKEYSISEKLRLIDGFNQIYMDKTKLFYDIGPPEAIIPYDISPSMIKSIH